MAEFNAAQTLNQAQERREQAEHGEKFIPVLTAIIAVFAALATLFSNHSSVTGLQDRTQAGILMMRANQAILTADIRRAAGGSELSLKKAQSYEAGSDEELVKAERALRSYESFEVSATLFEVAIVIVSITALMRGAKPLIIVGTGAAVVGLGFFISGMLMR